MGEARARKPMGSGVIPQLGSAGLLEEKLGPGPADLVSLAPGRVNLIGEHTDYNEGFVLPVAIDRYTEIALRRRRDMSVRIYSSAFDESFSVELPLRHPRPQGRWHDYLLGILLEFGKFLDFPHGFDAAIVSHVPLGAGLSSSASLEVAFAAGIARLFGIGMEGLELVELCQRAERDFVGVPCGIMDQYVAYFGRAGHALLLDTRAFRHRAVPLELPGLTFLVIDSGTRRTLAGSGYAARRRECGEAARWLAARFPDAGIRSLRDVSPEMLDRAKGEMPEVLWRRARHVVEENERVHEAAEALVRGDAEGFGRLLTASHTSLRDLFEVSTPQLDFLVEEGLALGALGARLVGGGFGGASLHLVGEAFAEEYVSRLGAAYRRRWGLALKSFEVRPGDGTYELARTSVQR